MELLTRLPQRDLRRLEESLGLPPDIKQSNKRGRGGSLRSMRRAITLATIKTLRDWGMPTGQLREAARLLENASEKQLNESWIVAIENKDKVARDLVALGCEALDIEIDWETGQYDKARARDLGYEPDNPESLQALGERITVEGEKVFQPDPRRHFEYRLISDKEELANLTAQEGVDCRVHSLHHQVTELRKRAFAMGLGQGKRRGAN